MYDFDTRHIQQQIQLTPMKQSLTLSNQGHTNILFGSAAISNIKRSKDYTNSISVPPSLITELNEDNIVQSQMQITVDQFSAIHFKRRYYLLEVLFTYSFLIGINYLIKLLDLQYIAIIACLGLKQVLGKFKYDHLLILLITPILIANYFVKTQVLTPLQIICAYLSVSIFQPINIMDRLYPIILWIILGVYGFIALPLLYQAIAQISYGTYIYIYIFPVLDLCLEIIVDILILQLQNPSRMHYMVSLAQVGIYFGTAMMVSIQSVQFWYLCLLLSIKAMACKQQIIIHPLRKLYLKCRNIQFTFNRNVAYKSGYLIKMNAFIVLVVYIYAYLGFQNQPFVSLTKNIIEMYSLNWYQPLIFGLISSFYDIIILVININKPDFQKRVLLEDRQPIDIWWKNLLRDIYYSLINIFGLWMFYVGYCIPSVLKPSN